MRKFLILCSALLCLAFTASAQESTAASEATSATESAEPAPPTFIPPDREPWQVGMEFQYQHYNVLAQKFYNLALQSQVTRYFTNRFGVEGTALAGFGHVSGPPKLVAKSVFLGGGAHASIRNTPRLELWAHVLVGWERFRFTQTGTLGVNSHAAFMGGGGVDYKLRGARLFWRTEGDYFGTNLGPTFSNNFFVGTGLVLNF